MIFMAHFRSRPSAILACLPSPFPLSSHLQFVCPSRSLTHRIAPPVCVCARFQRRLIAAVCLYPHPRPRPRTCDSWHATERGPDCPEALSKHRGRQEGLQKQSQGPEPRRSLHIDNYTSGALKNMAAKKAAEAAKAAAAIYVTNNATKAKAMKAMKAKKA